MSAQRKDSAAKINVESLVEQIAELNDRAIALTTEHREPVSALKCLK